MRSSMLDRALILLASNIISRAFVRGTAPRFLKVFERPHALVKGRVFCRKYLTFVALTTLV
jgi:hypothetical protein